MGLEVCCGGRFGGRRDILPASVFAAAGCVLGAEPALFKSLEPASTECLEAGRKPVLLWKDGGALRPAWFPAPSRRSCAESAPSGTDSTRNFRGACPFAPGTVTQDL